MENLTVELCIPDKKRVIEVFRKIRWSKYVYCLECTSVNVLKRGFVSKTEIRRYFCNVVKTSQITLEQFLPGEKSLGVKCSTFLMV